MSLWERKASFEKVAQDEEVQGSCSKDVDPEENESEELLDSQLRAYRAFIPSTEAYEWLLTRLLREYRLVPTEPGTLQKIRTTIMSSLPSNHRISRKTSPQSCSARFELDWDIVEFFATQGYSSPPDQILEGIITVTGSCYDAQAATCAQYIRQTWPSTGEVMVQLVKKVLQGGESYSHRCKHLVPEG